MQPLTGCFISLPQFPHLENGRNDHLLLTVNYSCYFIIKTQGLQSIAGGQGHRHVSMYGGHFTYKASSYVWPSVHRKRVLYLPLLLPSAASDPHYHLLLALKLAGASWIPPCPPFQRERMASRHELVN